MKKTDKKKLRTWQDRLARNESAYSDQLSLMDGREALYLGSDSLRPITTGERSKKTPHVRNIVAELIESQVGSSIPQPKVTARRKKDELLAKLIEDMLRDELDRMPFELINDMASRTVPIQGGTGYLIEWDNTERTHSTVGELFVSALHPKQMIPQDGVYTGVEDMDYIMLRVPQTKQYIRRRYNVEVSDESESNPEVKGGDSAAEDMVTQIIAYYRNDDGGIGLYSWVNDTMLEDMEDFQARRLRRCKTCGQTQRSYIKPLGVPTPDGSYPLHPEFLASPDNPIEKEAADGDTCPYCGGGKWEESPQEYEEVWVPVTRSDGSVIPGETVSETLDDMGMKVTERIPTRIPYYKPNMYPIVLHKNVSVFGKFLGDSDVDKIKDQQNTTNRLEVKIIDKLIKSGSYITLPDNASIRQDAEDFKIIRPGDAASKALIDVYDLQGNVQFDLVYLSQVYEEARQIIGITDSFQGRTDRTATSGKAKEFAAAQSAGRLESKRVMKDAAYASLFEAMFKIKLSCADEPRPVTAQDIHGNASYREFNRYDFLERDEAGEWFWNDQFLFACDTTAPLASNREAMWQETRLNLQTGAFGDPASLATLILFWTKMEQLHYPGAGDTKQFLEEEMQQQKQVQQQQQMQAQQPAQAGGSGGQTQMMQQIVGQARQDAARDMGQV